MSTSSEPGSQKPVFIPAEHMRSVPIQMYWFKSGPEIPDKAELYTTEPIGRGTAFLYRLDGQNFMVTARHCLSGRHSETGKYLAGYSTNPSHMRFMLRKRPTGPGWQMGEPTQVNEFIRPLIGEDWKPIWFEHPDFGADVDIAVIPLGIDDPQLLIDPYEPPARGENDVSTQLSVAQDVFVVGYPYGLQGGFHLPLWVRGTIATEPALRYPHRGMDLPLLLVDGRTRAGQSGAPVITFRHPDTPVRSNKGDLGLTRGAHSQLIGVYSGRTSDESDLGFCWRLDALNATCRARKQADITHR